MPAIDINIHHLMKDAADSAASANGIGTGEGSSNNYLNSVLNRLDATIKKLDATITTKKNTEETAGGTTGGLASVAKSMGATIATAIATAVGVTVARYLNNQANAVMSRATNTGNFVASAIAGKANENFGNYASQFVQIEAQRRIANVMATGEGEGGGIGATIGTILGAGIGGIAGSLIGPEGTLGGGIAGAAVGGKFGAAFGGGTGAAAGKLAAASQNAQFIQMDALAKAAAVQREADASVSQWKTGFSRFGMQMTNKTLVGSDITGGAPITAPLQMDFERRYGKSQNFNAIQNQMVPFLTSNPLSSKTGDLNNISQQFLKAGFAVSDFSRLTMQSSQYAAITGKHFQDFSNDLVTARAKFGDAYDVSTNQTALNLMTLGYGKDQAQHLANQSMYNPGVMNSVSMLANSSYSDYYRRKSLTGMTGLDIGKSLSQGRLIGPNGKPISKAEHDQIERELSLAQSGGPQSLRMAALQSGGVSNMLLAQLAQGQVSEGKLSKGQVKELMNPELGPGQTAATQAGSMGSLLANVSSMMVNATQVTLINGGGNNIMSSVSTTAGNLTNKLSNAIAPSAHGSSSYTPTKH